MTDDKIQKAKAIQETFDLTVDEYAESNSLVDAGEWYALSGKQDEIISSLLQIVETQGWQDIASLENDEICDYWATNGEQVYLGYTLF